MLIVELGNVSRRLTYGEKVALCGIRLTIARHLTSPSDMNAYIRLYECTDTSVKAVDPPVVTGSPDPKHVSTSYFERAHPTMRMAMQRFTRLTSAFPKKLENQAHMVALYALWYNFVRVRKSPRNSLPIAAGIETRLWSMEDVVTLIDRAMTFAPAGH